MATWLELVGRWMVPLTEGRTDKQIGSQVVTDQTCGWITDWPFLSNVTPDARQKPRKGLQYSRSVFCLLCMLSTLTALACNLGSLHNGCFSQKENENERVS